MFKVVESDEEFEAALAAGLLWMNVSSSVPRPQYGWQRVTPEEYHCAETMWDCAKHLLRNAGTYQPEDFAVLVEDEGEGDG